MRAFGIILIILGALALVYTGFTFTTKEKVADIGPIEINKEKENVVSWPPIVGGILLVGGIAMVLTDKKR
jgi:uncharacterized membrane protein